MKTNYFVVGAAKSGTTSIFASLQGVDALSLPIEKETNRFNTGSSNVPGKGPGDRQATTVYRDDKTYIKNYSKPIGRSLVDFSVAHLYDDEAAQNIFNYNPNAHIIIILRKPEDRAFSHYLHLKRDCREQLSFEQALEAENSRIEEGYEFSWHYQKVGEYYEQVKRYVNIFPAKQVHIIKFDDFMSNPKELEVRLSHIFELPHESITLHKEKHNATGAIKSKSIAMLVNRPSAFRNVLKKLIPREIGRTLMNTLRSANMEDEKPVMSDRTKASLKMHYARDLDKLTQLTGMNFDNWKA